MTTMEAMAARENTATAKHWTAATTLLRKSTKVQHARNKVMQDIVLSVSEETGVPAKKIMSRSRERDKVSRARQVCMWLARKRGFTLTEIGTFFRRDHTTVGYAVRVIDQEGAMQ